MKTKKVLDDFFLEKAKETLLARGITEEVSWDGRDGLARFDGCCCPVYLIIVKGVVTGQDYLFFPESFMKDFEDNMYRDLED